MKIAVYINGSGRYIEDNGKIFAEWNNLYNDIEFDYYVATWEDEVDYSKLKWITKYERLKEEDSKYFDLVNYKDTLGHQPHFTYSLFRVNYLRNQSNIKYDAVLQLRTDLVLCREILDGIVNQLRKGEVKDNLMFNTGSVEIFKGNFWCQDYFMLGTPKTMDVYSMMWLHYFLDKSSYFYKNRANLILNHRYTAEFLVRNFIVLKTIKSKSTPLLIRMPFQFESQQYHSTAGWHRKHPSIDQLQLLLKEKGANYIMSRSYSYLIDYFDKTHKGEIKTTVIKGHKYNEIDIPEYNDRYSKGKQFK